jgi:hypothetical protein
MGRGSRPGEAPRQRDPIPRGEREAFHLALLNVDLGRDLRIHVSLPDGLHTYTARPIDLLRDMPQFVIIEPKHSAKQNYVPVSNLR